MLLAAGLLVPGIIGSLVVVAAWSHVLGSFLLIVAGWELNVVGIGLYYAVAVAIFLSLQLLTNRRGAYRVHSFSILLFATTVIACAWYLHGSWQYGLKYQGNWSVISIAWLDGLTVVGLIALLLRNFRWPTARTSISFHWLFVLWLFSYAFPYLGELP